MRDIVLKRTFSTQYLTEPLYEGDGGYKLVLKYGRDLTGCEIAGKVKRSDGTVVTYLGTAEGNYAYCRIEAGAFNVVGEVEIRLEIISGDGVVTAIDAEGVVKEKLGGTDVTSDDRYPVLTSLINEVRALKDEVANANKDIEIIDCTVDNANATYTFSGNCKYVVFCNVAQGDTAYFEFPEKPPEKKIENQKFASYNVTILNENYQYGCVMFGMPSGEIGSVSPGVFEFILTYSFEKATWQVTALTINGCVQFSDKTLPEKVIGDKTITEAKLSTELLDKINTITETNEQIIGANTALEVVLNGGDE